MTKEQERFNTQYSNEKEINIGSKGIFGFFKSEFAKSEGSLKIKGFKNLEIISLKELKLTSLKISNCSQLNKVHLFELTKLTSLSLTKCPKLTTDNCSLIKLTSLNSLKINNCSEFKKIFDLSALPKLKTLSIVGCSALTTFDYSPTGLIDLEISDCSQLNQITGFSKLSNLKTLSVRNCPKLIELDCSSIKTLTELEVSDLIELNCSNTSIDELSLNLCPNIKNLNCSNNHKLTNLDASNCSKLEFLDCTNSKLTFLDLSYCPESIDVKHSPSLIIARKKKDIKNILVVGRTGGGKSTLANVLTNSNEFKESAYAISETKYFRKKEFEWNEDNKEDNFRVVDTIGVGDTKLSTENTLFKIADGILSMPEGISHVLFVINGRFTKEEIDTFNLIKESLFKSDILRYVTIVRSNFSNFRTNKECDKDIELMRNESDIIAQIVNSCNGVVHVDNPSVDLFKDDDEDDDEYEQRIDINRNARKKQLG
ncbi:kinase-like domain-containing protein [Rhizophagus clarus]|uniref:Kinase-like domain-containing protein n=1 Tax=Rhizophagus clarus TaxID=94130 RepID=A0A8H3QRF1_9GLOM|nr:kinase-like domain-containing protein [Rhizophagus clarus]